jgi:hypothetical protein
MSSVSVDLDSEKILYEGQWVSREDLARKIKGMLDAGDFAVTKPSQALEQLTQTLQNLKTVSFKLTPELGEALNQVAARSGKTPEAVLREALTSFLTGARSPDTLDAAQSAARAASSPPPMPVPLPRVPTPPPAPAVAMRGTVVTEHVTPEEAESAVSLTPKKKEEGAVERGWFGT